MSSYWELLQKELLAPRAIHINVKYVTFRDEFLSGSSYFKDEIWSKMESLSVLNVFCTTSECATTSTSKFIKIQNFIIFFDFFSKNVWKNGQNFDEEFFGMSSWSFFWENIHPKHIIYKMGSLRRCSCQYPSHFVFVVQISKTPYKRFLARSSSRGVLTVRKVLPSKSMKSQLSNALSIISVRLLVQKIR